MIHSIKSVYTLNYAKNDEFKIFISLSGFILFTMLKDMWNFLNYPYFFTANEERKYFFPDVSFLFFGLKKVSIY